MTNTVSGKRATNFKLILILILKRCVNSDRTNMKFVSVIFLRFM
mgnify:CR=1 FL=1